MTINLYECTAENEVVDKSSYISGNVVTNCEIVNTDILNPILKLSSNYLDKNYVMIPEFENRYYYVSSIEMLRGGHMLMNCHVDVLMTYKPYILQSSCNIVRQENANSGTLTDSYYSVNNRKINKIKKFGDNIGSNFSDLSYCFLLAVR